MGKIRVLQINKMYYPVIGGVETVVRQIAEGLNDKTDMKALVCQPKGKGAVEIINGVEVHKAASLGIAFSMPVSLDFFFKFQKMKKKADIIHIHMPFPLADIAVRVLGFKGKIILWWHSDIVRQRLFLVPYKPFLEYLLRRADRIIVATEGHIEHSEHLREYRDKCVVIPFGVDQKIFERSERSERSEKSKTSERSKISKTSKTSAVSETSKTSEISAVSEICERNVVSAISDRLVSFLFVGRLIYYKGCDILVKAFSRVRGATLTIVGGGPLEDAIKEDARKLGIAGSICFKQKMEARELSEEYANCDVLVLPSVAKSEAFGIVQIEAMSFGKPVINTNLPSGVPQVSLDGVTGLTVEPGNVDALANAMQRLVDDRDLKETLGKNAYTRVRAEFTMGKMIDSIYREYEDLALNG